MSSPSPKSPPDRRDPEQQRSVPGGRRLTDLETHDHQHVTVDQIAGYFGVDQKTVYKWIDSGVLRAYRIDRMIRVDLSDLKAFRDSHRITPRPTETKPRE